MTTIKSSLIGRSVIVEFPDSPEKLLIVEVEIDCPSCGQHLVRFAGHHLRALRNLLVEIIDLHPELVGDEAGLDVIKRMTFKGTSTPRPEDN